MFLILFLIWIIFNGRITVEVVLFGLIFSAVILWFMCKYMNYKFKYEFYMFNKVGLIIKLLGILAIEIAKANEQLLYWIFSNKYRMEPAVVVFKVDLKHDWSRVILGNCITLTPGTITASIEGNEFTVHCLDKELGKDLANCAFVRILRKLEDKA